MAYRDDYPKEPIGGGNPYWRCKACGLADPQINGRLSGHLYECEWRKAKERLLLPKWPPIGMEVERDGRTDWLIQKLIGEEDGVLYWEGSEERYRDGDDWRFKEDV